MYGLDNTILFKIHHRRFVSSVCWRVRDPYFDIKIDDFQNLVILIVSRIWYISPESLFWYIKNWWFHGPRRSQRSFQGAVDDLGESLNFDHRMEGEANLWMDFTWFYDKYRGFTMYRFPHLFGKNYDIQLDGFYLWYPLVNVYIAIENHHY